MRNLRFIKEQSTRQRQVFEALPGAYLPDVLNDLLDRVAHMPDEVTLHTKFNGRKISVNNKTVRQHALDNLEIWSDFEGPVYPEVWPEEKQAYEAEQARRQRECQAAQKQRDLIKLARLDGVLSMCSKINIVDRELWEDQKECNKSDYGAAAIRYAEHWGRLMQRYDVLTQENVDEAASLADYDGITGFMHGYARKLLIQTWSRGAELSAFN